MLVELIGDEFTQPGPSRLGPSVLFHYLVWYLLQRGYCKTELGIIQSFLRAQWSQVPDQHSLNLLNQEETLIKHDP